MKALLARLVLVIAAVALWFSLSPPAANDVVGGDEGYYGVMARNLSSGARYLASPALTPLGPPGDKPPLYPALLALSIRAFGANETGLRVPSFVLAALVALGAGALVARAAGGWAGLAAAGFLVSLPWFADSSRVAQAEIPLTALGVAALVMLAGREPASEREGGELVARLFQGRRATVPHALGAGALLGLAFLCKLWLVALIAIPAVFMILPDGRALVALIAGALLVGSLHLIGVAIVAPHDLAHWRSVYLDFSLASRLAGQGFAADWIKPPVYYLAILGHAFVLLIPLVLIGVWEALRRRREPLMRALLVWALGFVPLSLFSVKSGAYLYPIVPAWACLAAVGLAAVARHWRVVAIVVGIALTLAGFAREVQRLPLRYHRPGYREVAAAIAPYLATADPARASFVAPEAPAFAYSLFRTGRYWGTPLEPWSPAALESLAADTALRAFVVDPSERLYGGWPDSTTLGLLALATREITADIERASGRKLEVRVFVRANEE